MADTARKLGMEYTVGNLLDTSLAMAPAFLLGQHRQVDLDEPRFLKADRHELRAREEIHGARADQGLQGPRRAG